MVIHLRSKTTVQDDLNARTVISHSLWSSRIIYIELSAKKNIWTLFNEIIKAKHFLYAHLFFYTLKTLPKCVKNNPTTDQMTKYFG